MSEAREAVLGRLREARRRSGRSEEQDRATVGGRLAAPEANLIPARGDLELEGRVELFRLQAEAVQTVVERVAAPDRLPEAVAAFLRRHNLPLQVVVAGDPWLDGARFEDTILEVERGRPAREPDPVGLTVALAGVAETGTLMLRSSPATPTTLAFLPDTSVVVLPTARVLRAYEDALALLREEGALPRSVNFITGPSRTADIEQTLQLGAHGPRRLLVVLVDRPGASAT